MAFSLSSGGENITTVIGYIQEIVNIINPILVAMAFLFFFWGLSKFILSSGNQAEVEKGKNYMLWGILALFILLTFRAIISLVAGELEIGGEEPLLPHVLEEHVTTSISFPQ